MATITTGPFNITYVNGFSIYETDELPLVSEDDTVESDVITANISGKKIGMGVKITDTIRTQCSFELLCSIDQTTWVKVTWAEREVIHTFPDATPAGIYHYLVDLTNIHFPFYKLVLNREGVSLTSSDPNAQKFSFIFAV